LQLILGADFEWVHKNKKTKTNKSVVMMHTASYTGGEAVMHIQ
jgi:hypothetical protein